MRYLEQRRGQRGQVLVVVALMFVAIVGAMAIAIDLSSTTNAHRIISNWSDASAIAGVRNCDSACNAKVEVQDAIQMVLQNSPWSASATWALTAPLSSPCNASSCSVTNYAGPAGFTQYLVSVSSPPDPATTTNPAYITTNYVEVHIKETLNTSFAGAIGIKTTKTIGHSVAFDAGPPAPYQYTFFSKKQTCSGNQDETIQGDAFLGDGYCPQSAGQSELCVTEVAEPTPDNIDGGGGDTGFDNDLDNQGHVVFSQVPPNLGHGGINYSTACGGGGGALNIQQTTPSAGAGCSSGSTPTQSGGVWYCLVATPAVPSVPPPTATKSAVCAQTIDNTWAAGVYPVSAGCNVTLDFAPGNIQCISLLLGANATVQTNNKKGNQWMTAYGFDPTGDATAAAAMNSVSSPAQSTACAGHTLNNDRSVIWAPDPGTNPMATPVLTNGLTGCCSQTLFIGTIFLPNQMVSYGQNQQLGDVGSVYVGDWEIQSGNHPNPSVTYDVNATAFMTTSLRLAE